MLLLAIHGGAGDFSSNKDIESRIKKGLKEACLRGQNGFRDNQDTCIAVRESIVALEDDPNFNAGTGSNLTADGCVECDAAIMNAAEDFGAVSVMTGVKNPIVAAHKILLESQTIDPHGRIPALLVAGRSESVSSTLVDPATMITPKARSDWKRWKSQVDSGQATQDSMGGTVLQDTVGAVACAIDGDVSAGVSSGGILLKRPGRVGEAATFGSGCWASGAHDNRNAVACSISGAGEMIMRASLARQLVEAVRHSDSDTHEEMERALANFKEMCAQRRGERPNAGIIMIVGERQEDGAIKPRLWCGFTTPSFAVAYMSSNDSEPKATILRRPKRDDNHGLYITSLPLDD